MEGLSPADVAAMSNDGGGLFGGRDGGGVWIFALLILLLIGNGGLFGGNRGGVMPQAATTQDVQNSTDFAALERQLNEGVAATRQASYDVTSSVKDAAFTNLQEIRDIQAAVAANGFNLQNCCCETQRAIDGVKFDMANYACAIQSNDTANTQKILDAISTNRMADMQNQINQLQLSSALCGVVRYPNAMTYNAGTWPYNCNCSSGCGC